MTTNATATNIENHDPIVVLDSVVVAFGGLIALSGIDLEITRGERLAVLGPNGAGKTTMFNAIAGDITPTDGRVLIRGIDCTDLPSRMRPRLSVARTYQKTRLFAGLTVEDNLYLAQTGRNGPHISLWRTNHDAKYRERARDTAKMVWLYEELGSEVGDLSHGQQRQLEIGMALVTEPDLIMLDEPASGLSRGERERLIELLENLPVDSTLILIEHDMDVALKVAQRVIVMSDGSIIALGTPDAIRRDPLVHAVYLGQQGVS